MKSINWNIVLRWLWRSSWYTLYLGATVLFLLELCYRQYWVDFYGAEFQARNTFPVQGNIQDSSTILVFGDSFSAAPGSFTDRFAATQGVRVWNAAISGTCPREHSLFAKQRIAEFAPDAILYQLYVGNDLVELRHHPKTGSVSWVRRCYWWLSDRIWVLHYLNKRLLYVRQLFYKDLPTAYDSKYDEAFDPSRYNGRTKLLFKAEPNYLEESILLTGPRRADFVALAELVEEVFSTASSSCQKYLLVLPHCAQVDLQYHEQMVQLGADFSPEISVTATNYPLLQALDSTFAKQGVTLLNPLPFLQQKTDSISLYYENDPHLSPYGQALLAEWLQEQLNY